MLRGRALAIALCACASAHAAPQLDIAAAAAWKGWSRPGRTTEVTVGLSADNATRATIELIAGGSSVRSELDLTPGRTLRLHIPLAAAQRITLSVAAAGDAKVQREIGIVHSESPLLGVALTDGSVVEVDGFHSVALGADDLPRSPAGYSSIDALVIDAPTLAALEAPQLEALLANAAGCGRIVVVAADARVRRVLDGAGGCGGRALVHADSAARAKAGLESSLGESLPAAMTAPGDAELLQPARTTWSRIVTVLAMALAAVTIAALLFPLGPTLTLTAAVAALAVLVLAHGLDRPSQLVVWSEADTGSSVARYQAWQCYAGVVRERTRVPIAPQLASSVQPCDRAIEMRFDYDAQRGSIAFAEFETRLFRQVSLCYAGSFPLARSVAVQSRADGWREVRNIGSTAWPAGLWLDGGQVHALPALGAGAQVSIDPTRGKKPDDAVTRVAFARLRPDSAAALWPLDLGGVAGIPAQSKGWLLLSGASR